MRERCSRSEVVKRGDGPRSSRAESSPRRPSFEVRSLPPLIRCSLIDFRASAPTPISMDQQPASFDTTLASNLFPQLVQLIQAASLQKPTAEDPEARAAKVEVGKQVKLFLPSIPYAVCSHSIRFTIGLAPPFRAQLTQDSSRCSPRWRDESSRSNLADRAVGRKVGDEKVSSQRRSSRRVALTRRFAGLPTSCAAGPSSLHSLILSLAVPRPREPLKSPWRWIELPSTIGFTSSPRPPPNRLLRGVP